MYREVYARHKDFLHACVGQEFELVRHLSRLVEKSTMWFPNRSDTNRPVQAQEIARDWKLSNCTIRVAKTKALISFAVTAKLICVFVFAYADCWLSHEAAHFDLILILSIHRLKCWWTI